ncbi:MAG: nucleotidyltransferase family protein [Chitinophagales bacterium]
MANLSKKKVMIFAAGLGTRLQPITNSIPKALVEVNNKPLLQYALEHLKQHQVTDVVINVHHFANLMVDFLEKHQNFGLNITISYENDELLETGGGLWKAKSYFNDVDDFIVCNADILCDIDLTAMVDFHQKNNCLATLAVSTRKSSRNLLFDDANQLKGWKNNKTEATISVVENSTLLQPFAFDGFHVISTKIFDFPYNEKKFSITDWYLSLCKEQQIMAYLYQSNYWFDIGTKEKLATANNYFNH